MDLSALNNIWVASSTSLGNLQILWNRITCDFTIPFRMCLGRKLLLCDSVSVCILKEYFCGQTFVSIP